MFTVSGVCLHQSYFRETSLPPVLPSLLLFPPALPPQDPAPQGFALQFWEPPQQRANAIAVVGVMGILVGSKGGSVSVLRLPLHVLLTM